MKRQYIGNSRKGDKRPYRLEDVRLCSSDCQMKNQITYHSNKLSLFEDIGLILPNKCLSKEGLYLIINTQINKPPKKSKTIISSSINPEIELGSVEFIYQEVPSKENQEERDLFWGDWCRIKDIEIEANCFNYDTGCQESRGDVIDLYILKNGTPIMMASDSPFDNSRVLFTKIEI